MISHKDTDGLRTSKGGFSECVQGKKDMVDNLSIVTTKCQTIIEAISNRSTPILKHELVGSVLDDPDLPVVTQLLFILRSEKAGLSLPGSAILNLTLLLKV